MSPSYKGRNFLPQRKLSCRVKKASPFKSVIGKDCRASVECDRIALKISLVLNRHSLAHAARCWCGWTEAICLAGRANAINRLAMTHPLLWAVRHETNCMTKTLRCTAPLANLNAYPRISPAVMVLGASGGPIFVGRSPHFKQGVFRRLEQDL